MFINWHNIIGTYYLDDLGEEGIIVNGCFWHAHEGCKYCNIEFRTAKFERNKQRDEEDYKAMHLLGWNVVVIWECQLKPKTKEHTLECLDYILNKVKR